MSYQSEQNPNYGQTTSSLAVISLIAGIASYFIVPVLGAIAAVITGGMAKKEILNSGGAIGGLGMAKWGVILGWINIGLGLIGICISILAIAGVVTLPFCFIPFSDLNLNY
jgi:hypothetical protein